MLDKINNPHKYTQKAKVKNLSGAVYFFDERMEQRLVL